MKSRSNLAFLGLYIAVVSLTIALLSFTNRHNAQLKAQVERHNAQLIEQTERHNAQLIAQAAEFQKERK